MLLNWIDQNISWGTFDINNDHHSVRELVAQEDSRGLDTMITLENDAKTKIKIVGQYGCISSFREASGFSDWIWN